MGVLSQLLHSWNESIHTSLNHHTSFEAEPEQGPVNPSDQGGSLAPDGLPGNIPPAAKNVVADAEKLAGAGEPQDNLTAEEERGNTKLTGDDEENEGFDTANRAEVQLVQKIPNIDLPDITAPPFRCKQNLPIGPCTYHPSISFDEAFATSHPGVKESLKSIHVTMNDVTDKDKPILHWESTYPIGAFKKQTLEGSFPSISGHQNRMLPFCPKDDRKHVYELEIEGLNQQNAVINNFKGKDHVALLEATRGPEINDPNADPETQARKVKMNKLLTHAENKKSISKQAVKAIRDYMMN